MRKRNSDERGQSMVLITLAMVGLIAFLALVIDGGMVFAERRTMQNAADAGTLAGVRSLFPVYYAPDKTSNSDYEDAILQAVHEYAEANGVEDSNGIPDDGINDNVVAYFVDDQYEETQTPIGDPLPNNGGIPAEAVGVEVTTETSFGSFFARVIGRDELGASALAASKLLTNPGGGDYAIWADSFDCGQNTVKCTGSDITINGCLHSNDGMHIAGSGTPATISGALEYCDELNLSNVSYGSLNPWPVEWCDPDSPPEPPWGPHQLDIRIARFKPGPPMGNLAEEADDDPDPDEKCWGTIGGTDWESCYHYFTGSGKFKFDKDDDLLPDGLYYFEGYNQVEINGSDLPDGDVNVTIVATGEIKMTSVDKKTLTAYSDLTGDGKGDLLLFSNDNEGNPRCQPEAINISSSGTEWNGIIFAPYGLIHISGSQMLTEIAGAIWGYAVELTGSLQVVDWNPGHVNPGVSPNLFLIR